MKKILAIALACVMAFGLVACGGSKIKDGTYSAEMSDASAEESHGWKDYLNITYKDGKIDTVEYDSKDADGNLKSQTTAETYPMDPAPSVWIPQMIENIKATSDPDKVAAIAGATHASENAKKLYKAVLEKANAGDTTVAVVD